jgi:hypothetical protein
LLWSCNVDMTLRAIDAHAPELTYTIRYEDLLADPGGRTAELYGWLGVERDDEERRKMLAATDFAAVPEQRRGNLERNRAARPGLWRQNLTDDEQRLCMEIMGPRLKRLGYEID